MKIPFRNIKENSNYYIFYNQFLTMIIFLNLSSNLIIVKFKILKK